MSAQADAKIAPADIIWAVDTAASMIEEAAQVQVNINAFASIISSSGVDVRVILISDEGQGQNQQGPPQPYEICIPPPLGNGAQPDGFCDGTDEKLPVYRHVVEAVTSNDALDVIGATYPQHQAELRPGRGEGHRRRERRRVLDERGGVLCADQGPDQRLAACLGRCGTCGACCPSCNPITAAEGAVYKELAAQAGGVFGDLCAQDFASVFADIAQGVIVGAQVPCEYAIPPPSSVALAAAASVGESNVQQSVCDMGHPCARREQRRCQAHFSVATEARAHIARASRKPRARRRLTRRYGNPRDTSKVGHDRRPARASFGRP